MQVPHSSNRDLFFHRIRIVRESDGKNVWSPRSSSGRHSADKSQLQVPRNPCRFEHVLRTS